MPVLDDGEGPIFESAAICLQLADLHADSGLAPPTGSHDRALVYQWAFFAMTELESPLADVSYGTHAGDGRGGDVRYPEPGAEQVAAATARFHAAAQVVEHALGETTISSPIASAWPTCWSAPCLRGRTTSGWSTTTTPRWRAT